LRQMFIWVTLQREFIHQYENAPCQVDFLRYPHRHLLHIKVKIEVYHNDRELEFILFKRGIDNHLNLKLPAIGMNASCEDVADILFSYLQEKYGVDRDIEIEVSEDAENGCELFYTKEE